MVHGLMAKAKTSKAAREAPDSSALLREARAALEREGSVKLTALGPASVRAALLDELTNEGFEITKSVVRKPIAEQLEALLADGAFIPLKTVAVHTAGATVAEAKQVALRLVAVGTARLVLRGTEEVLVPSNVAVLSRQELEGFEAVAKIVAKAAQSKNGASLLRADLDDALAKALPDGSPTANTRVSRVNPAMNPPKTNSGPDENTLRLLSAVDATRDVNTGLSFVPAIVARLQPSLNSDAARAALLLAANRGFLELRPEGGINRLSAEELALCPQGPQGTRLSWARRTEN